MYLRSERKGAKGKKEGKEGKVVYNAAGRTAEDTVGGSRGK